MVTLAAAALVFLHPADDDRPPEAVANGVWMPMPPSGLAARTDPSAIWTRRAMIVWGGSGDAGVLGDGAAYDLSKNVWTPLPPAPLAARRGHAAVWTGDRMLVWGGSGCDGLCPLGDGAVYDPSSNSWTAMAPAPIAPRSGHSAVFVEDRMIVWGGAGEGGGALSDGASYNPGANTWTMLARSPLAPRVNQRAVAATHAMLVWGGSSEAAEGGLYFADGAVYHPATDSWSAMAAPPASVTPRDTFAAVWTGTQLLAWGGYGRTDACTPCFLADGAAYDLDKDTWTPMAPSPLSGRGGPRAVWTTRDLLVWGGFDSAPTADGALYNPVDDDWARLPLSPLAPRQQPAMVWTGRQLVLWGGAGAGGRLADGAILTLTSA